MEYIVKPSGASIKNILEIENTFAVSLPQAMVSWSAASDGSDIYFGFKELQFFSVKEIIGEDIYQLNEYMPNSMPICLDGNGNIVVAKIINGNITGFYIASCGDLGWDEARLIAKTFPDFIHDNCSPEARLHG